MTDGPIVFAGLMPHAPILVPGVGRERLAEAAATTAAMTDVAQHAVAARPHTVVLISPHSPRRPGAFGLWQGPRLRGSLASFGSPADRVDLPVDECLANGWRARQGGAALRPGRSPANPSITARWCRSAISRRRDWSGPTVVLSLNYPGEGGLEALGPGDRGHRAGSAPTGRHHRQRRHEPPADARGARRFSSRRASIRRGVHRPAAGRRIPPAAAHRCPPAGRSRART